MEFLDAYPWLLAPAIFLARILDVSLGVLRTILVFRSYRLLAAVIGFVEVLIWVLAAGQVLQHLDRWYLIVAFAAGFASGNVVGIWLESKLAMGLELVRTISPNPEVRLAQRLREEDFSVTELSGRGDEGEPVEVLLVVERRRKIPELLQVIREHDPEAICTLSDVRHRADMRPPRLRRPLGPAGPRSVSKRK